MIRAGDRDTITIPAEVGEPVEIRVQGYQLRVEAGTDGAVAELPPLFFGNGTEVPGTIWKGKNMTRLKVEKR